MGGYSFYTGELNIEQCVTVAYGVNVQPVLAFVAGVQIEVMPKPLVSVEATVCWPKERPDGQDLSMLRMKISTSGVLLFSKTLRLAKRYRDPTDFLDHHGHLHRTMANWEQETNPRSAISRTNLMQTGAGQAHNQSHAKAAKGKAQDDGEQGVFEWVEDEEGTYLASASYSPELGVNLTSAPGPKNLPALCRELPACSFFVSCCSQVQELHGAEAKKRLSLAATEAQGASRQSLLQGPGHNMSGCVSREMSRLLQLSTSAALLGVGRGV